MDIHFSASRLMISLSRCTQDLGIDGACARGRTVVAVISSSYYPFGPSQCSRPQKAGIVMISEQARSISEHLHMQLEMLRPVRNENGPYDSRSFFTSFLDLTPFRTRQESSIIQCVMIDHGLPA